jgi:hypothetical protein
MQAKSKTQVTLKYPSHVTGIGSPVKYFFKAYKTKSALSVNEQTVLKFLAFLLFKRKVNMKFLLAPLNSKNCSESRIQYISVLAFLCSHCSIFSVYIFMAGSGTIFRVTGGFRNSFQIPRRLPESRKKPSEECYWKDFHSFIEENRNFTLDFLDKKTTKM